MSSEAQDLSPKPQAKYSEIHSNDKQCMDVSASSPDIKRFVSQDQATLQEKTRDMQLKRVASSHEPRNVNDTEKHSQCDQSNASSVAQQEIDMKNRVLANDIIAMVKSSVVKTFKYTAKQKIIDRKTEQMEDHNQIPTGTLNWRENNEILLAIKENEKKMKHLKAVKEKFYNVGRLKCRLDETETYNSPVKKQPVQIEANDQQQIVETQNLNTINSLSSPKSKLPRTNFTNQTPEQQQNSNHIQAKYAQSNGQIASENQIKVQLNPDFCQDPYAQQPVDFQHEPSVFQSGDRSNRTHSSVEQLVKKGSYSQMAVTGGKRWNQRQNSQLYHHNQYQNQSQQQLSWNQLSHGLVLPQMLEVERGLQVRTLQGKYQNKPATVDSRQNSRRQKYTQNKKGVQQQSVSVQYMTPPMLPLPLSSDQILVANQITGQQMPMQILTDNSENDPSPNMRRAVNINQMVQMQKFGDSNDLPMRQSSQKYTKSQFAKVDVKPSDVNVNVTKSQRNAIQISKMQLAHQHSSIAESIATSDRNSHRLLSSLANNFKQPPIQQLTKALQFTRQNTKNSDQKPDFQVKGSGRQTMLERSQSKTLPDQSSYDLALQTHVNTGEKNADSTIEEEPVRQTFSQFKPQQQQSFNIHTHLKVQQEESSDETTHIVSTRFSPGKPKVISSHQKKLQNFCNNHKCKRIQQPTFVGGLGLIPQQRVIQPQKINRPKTQQQSMQYQEGLQIQKGQSVSLLDGVMVTQGMSPTLKGTSPHRIPTDLPAYSPDQKQNQNNLSTKKDSTIPQDDIVVKMPQTIISYQQPKKRLDKSAPSSQQELLKQFPQQVYPSNLMEDPYNQSLSVLQWQHSQGSHPIFKLQQSGFSSNSNTHHSTSSGAVAGAISSATHHTNNNIFNVFRGSGDKWKVKQRNRTQSKEKKTLNHYFNQCIFQDKLQPTRQQIQQMQGLGSKNQNIQTDEDDHGDQTNDVDEITGQNNKNEDNDDQNIIDHDDDEIGDKIRGDNVNNYNDSTIEEQGIQRTGTFTNMQEESPHPDQQIN